jgi:hypothetical protein
MVSIDDCREQIAIVPSKRHLRRPTGLPNSTRTARAARIVHFAEVE